MVAEYRGAVASEAGDPAEFPGMLKALRDSTEGPQRHLDDPVDTPGWNQAMKALVDSATIDLVSDDDSLGFLSNIDDDQ